MEVVSIVDYSTNPGELSTYSWSRRHARHTVGILMTFYHINITQRKLTLSIKKNFTICTFFLAVRLQHSSLDKFTNDQ